MESSLETQPISHQSISYGQWALYIFLSQLPLIGLILLLVWAFSSEGNVHRKAWAKGMLLLMVIVFILAILFMILFGASLAALSKIY